MDLLAKVRAAAGTVGAGVAELLQLLVTCKCRLKFSSSRSVVVSQPGTGRQGACTQPAHLNTAAHWHQAAAFPAAGGGAAGRHHGVQGACAPHFSDRQGSDRGQRCRHVSLPCHLPTASVSCCTPCNHCRHVGLRCWQWVQEVQLQPLRGWEDGCGQSSGGSIDRCMLRMAKQQELQQQQQELPMLHANPTCH